MKQFYILLFCLIAFCAKSQAQAGNYLPNGNFEEDFKNWIYGATNGSAIDFAIETANPISGSKSAKLTFNSKGVNSWDAFLNTPLTLHKGVPMRISLKAKASAATFFNLEVAQNYPPFLAPMRTTQNVPLTTQVQTLEYLFTPDFSDGNMKVSFLIGNIDPGVTIWIDDVEVRQVDGSWDGNIIPNGDFNEFTAPVTADNFPAYRKKKLSYSASTLTDGGWEGGYAETVENNDIVFDIDQTGKLNGANSAHIKVTNKANTNFFNGSYAVFFQASEGGVYNFSADVVASNPVTFRVAMNTHPFDGPDKFSFDVNATTTKQTISANNITLVKPGFHQIFFAGYPAGGPYDIYIDNVKLTRVGGSDPLSVKKEVEFGKFTVYPNPTSSGMISLNLSDLPQLRNASIEVIDIKGNRLLHMPLASNQQPSINTNLRSGVYVVRIVSEHSIYTQKLLVN